MTHRAYVVLLLLFLGLASTLATRPRSLSQHTLVKARGGLTAALTLLSTASAVRAAQGAFEMDAEYYLRNAFKTQSSQKDAVRTVFKSPRKLDKEFANDIVERAVIANLPSGFNRARYEEEQQKQYSKWREFAPFAAKDLSDQYWEDLSLYCIYMQAGEILPSSEKRVAFREKVGGAVLDLAVKNGCELRSGGGSGSQTEIARDVFMLLSFLQSKGQVAGFVYDADDFGDEEFAEKSYAQKLPVSATIQLKEPCNVISFIQGVKENTFFHPEFIGSALVALIERSGKFARFEDYLLDNFYRESNFDTQAQDVVIELQMRGDKEFRMR